MKKYLAGNIKGCQKKVSQLLVALKLTYFCNSKIVVGNLLKQYQASFSHGNIINDIMEIFSHGDNRINDISVLGEGPTQHLGNITITAQAKYPINFTNQKNKFCLSLHYNGTNRFLYVNDVKIYQFKAKDSEI